MLKNNNQTAIRHISKSMMKGNRTRNRVAILAIILTTFMFTTVFSIGISLAENMRIMILREQGTKASVFLPNPSEEQINQVKETEYLYAAGVRINAAVIELENDVAITVDYYDETEFEQNYKPAISHIKGSYPQKKDEIMLSRSALNELGTEKIKLGMEIKMPFRDGEKTFYLSGWFQDYETFSDGCHAFVSEKYIEAQGLTMEKNGVLSMSAEDGKQQKFMRAVEEEIELRDGQELASSYDMQTENSSNNMVIAVVIGLLGLLIILSGYLLIYNVMYISVSKDIRFYGLLKTIGATPGQITAMVRQQAWRLSAIGIPVGIALGTVVSFVAVPLAIKMFTGSVYSAMPTDVRFRPLLYVGTIAFAVITVALSCRKPARMASQTAPVEAMKFNGVTKLVKQNKKQKSKRKKRKDYKKTHGGRPYKMAWRNVFREKKRAVLVFASLIMGTLVFLSVNTFLGCIKLENYVKTYLPYDYEIYTNGEEEEEGREEIARLAKRLTTIKGVTNSWMNYSTGGILEKDYELYKPFIEELEQDMGKAQAEKLMAEYGTKGMDYSARILYVGDEILQRYNEDASHPLDMERFQKGEICLVGWVYNEQDADAMIGKKLTITGADNQQNIEMEIGSVATVDNRLDLGVYWQVPGAPHYIVVSEKVLNQLTDTPDIDCITMNCEEASEKYVTSQVKKMIDNSPVVAGADIKSDMIKDFQSSMSAMRVLASGISIVLILIGVLNFVNVMLTGVYSRRKELAMLESVGMTKRQIRRMLIFEGVYYGSITSALVMTLGSAILYYIGLLSMEIADYAVFDYPWMLMMGVVIVIFTICMIVPVIVYKNVSKESVTERLRAIE